MSSRNNKEGGRFQLLGRRRSRIKVQTELARNWRDRSGMHDPMLVLNMSVFNFTNGWSRTFNPLKAHENAFR